MISREKSWLKLVDFSFVICYNIVNQRKELDNIKKEHLEKDYEELYRLANAIDRFGLDIIMEVIHR